MSKINGFTLLEVLIAFNLVIMIAITITPITYLLHQEKVIFRERIIFSSLLHDELQKYLWEEEITLPERYSRRIESKTVTFSIGYDGEFVKGCAKWENGKSKQEQTCLYGLRED